MHRGEKREKRIGNKEVHKAGVVKQKGPEDSANFLPSQAAAVSESLVINRTNSHGLGEVPESQ